MSGSILEQIAAVCKKHYLYLKWAKRKEVRNIEVEYQIVRQREGFRVISGREHYYYDADLSELEAILDNTVLPRIARQPGIKLDELVTEVEGEARRESRDTEIPWTGLHLLVQWRLMARQSEGLEDDDRILRKAANLLSAWHEAHEPPIGQGRLKTGAR